MNIEYQVAEKKKVITNHARYTKPHETTRNYLLLLRVSSCLFV